jgi:hypothetical protein
MNSEWNECVHACLLARLCEWILDECPELYAFVFALNSC